MTLLYSGWNTRLDVEETRVSGEAARGGVRQARQQWNAADYAREGRFVATLAQPVVALLNAREGERILDLGCGDGVLTANLRAAGVSVLGVDSSASMVEAARALGVDAQQMNMERLPFEEEFDAVFSNAALHWVGDQEALLAGVRRALKPGGRFVAEMGGHGNVAALRTGLRAALEAAGYPQLQVGEGDENYFPSPEIYRRRLEAHGFTVASMELIPRPTPLGPGGVLGWYRTFRTGVLEQMPEAKATEMLAHAERLLSPMLRDETGAWIADYVRLRFVARVS